MANVKYSLFYEKITYFETYIGLINWEDTHYPMGLYIVLCFLSCYDPSNLFILIKFLGPFINLVSCTCIYFVSLKITKNKYASLIGMLAWISSYFINSFVPITVPSGLGILLLFLSFLFLLKKIKYQAKLQVYFWVVDFSSTLLLEQYFFFQEYVYIMLLFSFEQRKNFLYHFFFTMFIILIPYILLFKYPGNIFITIFEYSIFDKILLTNIVPRLPLIEIEFNLYDMRFVEYGPTMIFYVIILFAVFSSSFDQYKEELVLFFGTLFFSLIYIFNPFIINGIVLRDILDSLYVYPRGAFFLTISCTYLSVLAVDSIQRKILTFKQKFNEDFKSHFFKFDYIDRLFKTVIILLLSSQVMRTTDHFSSGYGFFWPNDVPEEYTEILLWISQNVDKKDSIIVPNFNWDASEKIIRLYHDAFVYQYQIKRDNSFYQMHNFSEGELQSMGFFDFDYIVVSQKYVQSFIKIIENRQMDLVFSSLKNGYFIYKIED